MFHLGERSEMHLQTCHPTLQMIIRRAIRVSPLDFTVLRGYRSRVAQNRAFRLGYSTLKFPESKHNRDPSLAVDVAPWPIDWNDRARFFGVAGAILATASLLEVPLRWGGDWDSDGEIQDENFPDLGHFELTQLPLMG